MTRKPTAPIRTVIVRLTIGSFSLAALMGVIALVGGGEFGATEGRILLTTLLVGVVSVAVLCYLATAGTPFQVVGVAGGLAVLVPLVSALLLIWGDWDNEPAEWVGKTFGVGAVVAVTLAQASLLLALGGRARPLVRRLLVGTLVMAAVLAGLVSYLILGPEPEGPYFRVLGVVAILDVLGTVVVAALTRFGAGDGARASAGAPVTIPAELAARLDAHVARTGKPRNEVVAMAVERYLDEAAEPAGPTSRH
jgi:F0F1-type ATP synthase assembly protein I